MLEVGVIWPEAMSSDLELEMRFLFEEVFTEWALASQHQNRAVYSFQAEFPEAREQGSVYSLRTTEVCQCQWFLMKSG